MRQLYQIIKAEFDASKEVSIFCELLEWYENNILESVPPQKWKQNQLILNCIDEISIRTLAQ